jgi:hypothetical protein
MHDISRHAIHKSEVLSVTIETMRELQKYQTEVHEGLPDDLKNNDNLLTYHSNFLILLRYHPKSFLLLTYHPKEYNYSTTTLKIEAIPSVPAYL